MIMHEFGENNKDSILLLHGAGCTYKMWTPQIKELQKDYHLYVPSMSGHEPGDIDFMSSREEAKIIVAWFYEHEISTITMVCGASLGAHVGAEILQAYPQFAKYAMIESLKAYHYKGVMLKIFSLIGKKILKKCAAVSGCMAGIYEQEYASNDSKYTISHMSENSLNQIMIETGDYRIKDSGVKISTITLILYGEKEKKECMVNTNILKKQINHCKIIEIPMFHHGELAIGHPKKHLEYVRQLLSGEFSW